MKIALSVIILTIDALLLLAAIKDIKYKKISRFMLVLIFTLSIAASVVTINLGRNISFVNMLGGASIGVCMLGISMLTNEQIGKGDGYIMISLGFILGFRDCLVVLCMASFIMAGISIVILILRKGNKNTRLAFVPAIFVSFTVVYVLKNTGSLCI